MSRAHRRLHSTLALTFAGRRLLFATARDAAAQAWVPPRGMGLVSLTYQRINTTGHRRTNGFLVERGQSINMGLYVEGEYAFTDRLSVSAGLPYVFAKYTATIPPAPPIPYPPEDECHCWNSGWQDFGFTVRHNLVGGAFALTPSVVGRGAEPTATTTPARPWWAGISERYGSRSTPGSASTRSRRGCPCRAVTPMPSSNV